jgi:light-regulated signal transduction histidine kinase (bacteriophytochrome)
MNHDSNALQQCELEPLAFSGMIQPHGALLFIEKSTGIIRYASANAASMLGQAPNELLGIDGKDWITQNLPDLASWPESAGKRQHFSGSMDMGCGPLDVLVSGTSAGWIVEFEPSGDLQEGLSGIRLERPIGAIDREKFGLVKQGIVQAVAQATGYDRVMLYQFHPDWSGEVLAEAVDSVKGSYLGLRFPASDIPAIARGLYAQTPYRHIPDSSSQPVPIMTRAGAATEFDLTWSDLRSVSPVHMQYLANMQVGSSFSVSIMVDGKLWGLVACHNTKSKVIPLAAREQARKLVAEFVQVYSEYRNTVRRALHASVVQVVEPLRAAVKSGSNLAAAFEQQSDKLAALTGTSAAAVFVGDEMYAWDARVSGEALKSIHSWCMKNQTDAVFCLDDLPARMGAGTAMPDTCGVLGLSLRAKQLNGALFSMYLFRPEEAGEIAWAGNPNKPVEQSNGEKKLSPRSSFDKWVEVRNGHSRAWDDDARFVGQQLRELLAAQL